VPVIVYVCVLVLVCAVMRVWMLVMLSDVVAGAVVGVHDVVAVVSYLLSCVLMLVSSLSLVLVCASAVFVLFMMMLVCMHMRTCVLVCRKVGVLTQCVMFVAARVMVVSLMLALTRLCVCMLVLVLVFMVAVVFPSGADAYDCIVCGVSVYVGIRGDDGVDINMCVVLEFGSAVSCVGVWCCRCWCLCVR